jgi:hypothetical protein
MTKSKTYARDRTGMMIDGLILGGGISAADVTWLRREVLADSEFSREVADKLFEVERSGADKCPEWTEFFVEMITEHVVWQLRATGVVNEAQAEWLITRADESMSIGALAALVNVLAKSHRAPPWLCAAVRTRAGQGWPGVDEALHAALAA